MKSILVVRFDCDIKPHTKLGAICKKLTTCPLAIYVIGILQRGMSKSRGYRPGSPNVKGN